LPCVVSQSILLEASIWSNPRVASARCNVLVNNGFANRRQRNACQLQMLQAKGNADDGDKTQQRGQTKPAACERSEGRPGA
jgi:hypothetical protein